MYRFFTGYSGWCYDITHQYLWLYIQRHSNCDLLKFEEMYQARVARPPKKSSQKIWDVWEVHLNNVVNNDIYLAILLSRYHYLQHYSNEPPIPPRFFGRIFWEVWQTWLNISTQTLKGHSQSVSLYIIINIGKLYHNIIPNILWKIYTYWWGTLRNILT